MSKRLQLVMTEEEMERLRRCAEREGLAVSEWVRRALQRAEERQLGPTPKEKLAALDRALSCGHPTGDIERILDDIGRGRGLG